MLRSHRDQISYAQRSTGTAFDNCAKELAALRESDGVEMTRGVEDRRSESGEAGELVTDGSDMAVGGSEEGCASVLGLASCSAKRRCSEVRTTDMLANPLSCYPRYAGESNSLITAAIISNLDDPHKDARQIGPGFQVALERNESWSIVSISQSMPDLSQIALAVECGGAEEGPRTHDDGNGRVHRGRESEGECWDESGQKQEQLAAQNR